MRTPLPTVRREGRMQSENLTRTLADGRTLAWAEYGVPDGRSVLFFHGGNDSRLAGRLLADAATRANVRLICPDRPGYGASTFSAGRTFLDWANDVGHLTDGLGITGYRVVGHSGGGPHALACAHSHPGRVQSVATVSSPAPQGKGVWGEERGGGVGRVSEGRWGSPHDVPPSNLARWPRSAGGVGLERVPRRAIAPRNPGD